jgi:hypothetical protein
METEEVNEENWMDILLDLYEGRDKIKIGNLSSERQTG